MREYEWYFRESGISWGIYIKINCETSSLSEHGENVVQVNDVLYFSRESHPKEDPDYASKMSTSFFEGLKLVANEFSSVVKKSTVIKVIHMDWTPTDFQIEAYGYGIAGWVIQEFKLDTELPDLQYDGNAGRYIFPYHIAE